MEKIIELLATQVLPALFALLTAVEAYKYYLYYQRRKERENIEKTKQLQRIKKITPLRNELLRGEWKENDTIFYECEKCKFKAFDYEKDIVILEKVVINPIWESNSTELIKVDLYEVDCNLSLRERKEILHTQETIEKWNEFNKIV